jgi:REP-associated tyrosine transposase
VHPPLLSLNASLRSRLVPCGREEFVSLGLCSDISVAIFSFGNNTLIHLSNMLLLSDLLSMRQPRIKGQGESFYHCASRVVEGRFLFQTESPGSIEAEHFVYLMRRLEKAFCVQVLTYALMANHFHILCKVPAPRTLTDQELLDCIEVGYGSERRAQVAELLVVHSKDANSSDQGEQLRQHYLSRLFDVSTYMKELKGRFAQWYNRRHQRYGVLWAERFKSVLIEGGQALSAVSAYIDLNPLRAGLCEDPKDYRYCGYAEAIAKKSAHAKLGLREVLGLVGDTSWKDVSREYRKLLFQTGTAASKAGALVDPKIAHKVVQKDKGEIPLSDLLRCRVRYFTDGGILGSRAFVQEQFARCRKLAVPLTADRGHRLKVIADEQIWALRDLRLRPVG